MKETLSQRNQFHPGKKSAVIDPVPEICTTPRAALTDFADIENVAKWKPNATN